jgi:hypothetical protein
MAGLPMLAEDVLDRTQTGGSQAAGYGARGARRDVRRPIGYDKNVGAMPVKFDDLNRHFVVR